MALDKFAAAIVIVNLSLACGLARADDPPSSAAKKSVTYTVTRTNTAADGTKIEGEVRRVMILGKHRMREEVTDTPGDRPANLGVHEPYIMIHDAQSGKMLTLFPDSKAYDFTRTIFGIDANNQLVKEKVEPAPEIDYTKKIDLPPADKAQKVTDKYIDGKIASGLQTVEKVKAAGGTRTLTKTYWVDPKTKVLVRLESSWRGTDPMFAESDFVTADIKFDEPLDESLFSTDPPQGYKDLTRKDE